MTIRLTIPYVRLILLDRVGSRFTLSMAMERADAEVNALKSSNVAFQGARNPILKVIGLPFVAGSGADGENGTSVVDGMTSSRASVDIFASRLRAFSSAADAARYCMANTAAPMILKVTHALIFRPRRQALGGISVTPALYNNGQTTHHNGLQSRRDQRHPLFTHHCD